MKDTDIVNFLKSNIIPLDDVIFGKRYRASAFLKDGSYLPCVVFQSKNRLIDLAMKRLEETKNDKRQYRMVVEAFISNGSFVSSYDITRVEASMFALPTNLINKIIGETVMGWTEFIVEMHDGKKFPYGTSFSIDFFELPDDYEIKDIKEIHKKNLLTQQQPENNAKYYREKPFFTCLLDGL
ncbi:MAG: hypothetical protein VB050_15435 [Geobacteraceae bacterium]|nr:hypothetical protein [Geobacteraceae bacterium]